MNKMKITGILLLVGANLGITMPAAAADVSLCVGGICVERDRDGSGVDVRPDFGHRPPRRPPPHRPRPVPPRPLPIPERGWDEIICESRDQRHQVCSFNPRWVRDVYMDRQYSRAACIEGRTYGIRRDHVWVDRGCRARFIVDRY
jgi:hypothetical protein